MIPDGPGTRRDGLTLTELALRADSVALEALSVLDGGAPGSACSGDPDSRAHCLADLAHHVRYLSQAAQSPGGEALADYLAWLKALFDRLGFRDEAVLGSFRAVAAVSGPLLEAGSRAAFERVTEAAVADYPRAGGAGNRYLAGHIEGNAAAGAYLSALLEGKRDRAITVAESLAAGGMPVRELYARLWRPAQRELGRLWHLGEISVAQEHYATAATQYIISSFYPRLFAASRRGGPTLLAACAQGERHEMGLRMIADWFQSDGWDTRYLGADLPVRDLVAEAGRVIPAVVALSATLSANVPWIEAAIAALRSEERTRELPVLVGGIPFMVSPELWRTVGADGCASDFEEAVRAAEGLVRRSS
ncbi:MAG: cobalamin-dependent protein [Spirochaetales bacterium]|nr:cobalamin-dependent protein [Spirochaetales bacterium]